MDFDAVDAELTATEEMIMRFYATLDELEDALRSM